MASVSHVSHVLRVLCDGDLYEMTIDNEGALALVKYGVTHPVLCEEIQADDNESDYPYDVEQQGPLLILFRKAVYQKIGVVYGGGIATVEDSVPRVAPVVNDDSLSVDDYSAVGKQYPTMVLRPANVPAPVFAPIVRVGAFPRTSIRAMPPRNRINPPRRLPYGFDLPPAQQAITNFVTTPHDNALPPGPPGPIRRRIHWRNSHVSYLHELVWLAMLMLNREPKPTDYEAIVEALNRRFAGDRTYHPGRGYNAVHSKVVKGPGYQAFVAFVLP